MDPTASGINTTFSNGLVHNDNTATFIIGFGILLIFVVLGILASAFLCITLKKDPFLWDAERERQLQKDDECPERAREKERDKINLSDISEGIDV